MMVYIMFDNEIDKNVLGVYANATDALKDKEQAAEPDDVFIETHKLLT